MTTDDQAREWGRRALAVGFVWADGVAVVDKDGFTWRRCAGIWRHDRGLHNGPGYQPTADDPDGHYWRLNRHDPWIDFRDAATAGVLREWVRGLWGDPFMWSAPVVDGHTVRAWGVHRSPLRAFLYSDVFVGPTEVDAWLAAAEAKGARNE